MWFPTLTVSQNTVSSKDTGTALSGTSPSAAAAPWSPSATDAIFAGTANRSFQEPLYWVIDSIRITTALYLSVCKDLQTISSIRDISSRNGVSEAVTRHILDVTPAYVAPHLPETLCIDEFSGSAGHWDSEHYSLLKGSARILTTAKANQPVFWKGERAKKNLQCLEACLALSEELKENYEALQEMICAVHEKSYTSQRAGLEEWLADHNSSEYESVRHSVNTVRHNKAYILNAFKYGRTNAVCEGLNNKIKILKKAGYGVHKFDSFRKRILFACGPVKLVTSTYTIFAEKQAAGEVRK